MVRYETPKQLGIEVTCALSPLAPTTLVKEAEPQCSASLYAEGGI